VKGESEPFQPTPRQTVALLRMLLLDETPGFGELASRLGNHGRSERDRMIDLGLVEARSSGRGKAVFLTETGRAWLDSLDDFRVPESGQCAAPFQELLKRLKRYCDGAGLSLSRLVRDCVEPETACARLEPQVPKDIETEVRNAYFALSSGMSNVRVRLSDLRVRLVHVPRQELDEALTRMQKGGRLALYGLDDPGERTPDDESAALRVGRFSRYIVYMER
jgi:hypothetical protein